MTEITHYIIKGDFSRGFDSCPQRGIIDGTADLPTGREELHCINLLNQK